MRQRCFRRRVESGIDYPPIVVRIVLLTWLAACALACDRNAPDEASRAAAAPADPRAVWVPRTDAQLRAEIDAALERARRSDKQVLLEFGAAWCHDCNEVARLGELSPAREVIAERYERLFVDVGRFDRHRDLIERYGIDRIATLVILSPGGDRVAQTTLEPISNRTGLDAAGLASWLRNPGD